jgi:hypothetical protein
VVTVVTVAASPDWATATTAIGTVAVAVVAVSVAFFTERRAGRRLREEQKRSDDRLAEERALHAKEIAEERALADKRLTEQFAHRDAQLAEERAHLAAQLQKDRIWHRRADLYARTSLAMRRYTEKPPTGPDGQPMLAPDVLELANLASEASMIATEPLADLLNEFMYDFPDDARQLEIWDEFQHAARAELEVDRVQKLSTSASGAAPGDRLGGNPSAVRSSDP